MKLLLLIALNFFYSSTFAQSRYETRNEEIIRITENDTILNKENIGLCSLPLVSRDESDYLVNHSILVEVPLEGIDERKDTFPLKTDSQFESQECNAYRINLKSLVLNSHRGALAIKVRFTEKLITTMGLYMDKFYCHKEHIKLIEANIENVRYFKTVRISVENCI